MTSVKFQETLQKITNAKNVLPKINLKILNATFFQSQSQYISFSIHFNSFSISENTGYSYYRVIQSLCGDSTAAVLIALSTQAPTADTT